MGLLAVGRICSGNKENQDAMRPYIEKLVGIIDVQSSNAEVCKTYI